MDWDAELDDAALAEIERLEQEALRREAARNAPASPPPIIRQAAPKLPSPHAKPVTKQLTAASFAPPARPAVPSPSTSPLSSIARSPSQPTPASRLSHPIPNPVFPPPLPAPSLLPGEPLDELEEPAPGNTSVQPAPSSSPSRYTVLPSRAPLPVPPLMPQGPARKMYSGKSETASTSANRTPLQVDVSLYSRERVAVRIPSGWNLDVQRTAKGFPGAVEERDKCISLPIVHYHALVDALRRVPDLSLRLLYPAVYDLYVAKKQVPQPHPPPLDTLLPSDLNQTLLPFQREGVEFALKRDGRVLIGDEMGLGKTLQAIAIALCYRKEWPLLVICPASVKLQWAEHLEKYVPGLLEEDINLVLSGKKGHLNSLINIVSYDLCPKMVEQFSRRNFHVIICDESHFLKNWNSQRTKTIVPLIQRAMRAVLLSGTPAISRPKELWQQISAIDTPLFGSPSQPWSFYDRYCNAHRDRFGKLNSDGASNLSELHLLIQDTVMIRRLKADVMKHLPPKRRTEIRVEIAKKVSDAMKIIQAEKELARMKLDSLSAWDEEAIDAKVASRGLLMELYKDTGTAKIPAIVEYVSDLCESDQKFLVFAYHMDVLDALEHALTKKDVEFIRIDGTTPGHHRGQLTANFQSNPKIRVALLGITAAGVGLTLHAASTVVFAELYWNPGALLQAEDRAHRYGTQAESVNIYYIIAKKTIDESIWSMISKKLSVVGSALNGSEQKMNIEKTEKKATNQAVVDEYLGTLMGEIDTFDERQEAFRQRRADRKEVKQYLRGGPQADEDDIVVEDDGEELDPAPTIRQKRKITDDDADDNPSPDQLPDASHATKSARGDPLMGSALSPPPPLSPAKPLSSNIHMYAFNRPGAKPPAPPPAAAPAPVIAAAPAPPVPRVPASNSTSPAPAALATPLSSKISMFSFVRPGAAPHAPLPPPIQAKAAAVKHELAAGAVKYEPVEELQPVAEAAAPADTHHDAAEADAGADATLAFVRPKRNRFIADDE